MPDLGGKPCFGTDHHEEICSVPYCPVDGKWSEWSLWSVCSASCGSGTKIRYRKCDNPPAIHGGAYCMGDNVESSSCYVASCAGKIIHSTISIYKIYNKIPLTVHGGWSHWSPWSACSKTCGRGQKFRKRECNSPTPMNGGHLCDGTKFETKICKVRSCRNLDLVKSRNNHHQSLQSKFTPFMTFPTTSIELGESPEDYDFAAYGKYDYSESRPVHFVPPPPYYDEQLRGTVVEDDVIDVGKPQKVVIRVENFIPISDDTAQVIYCLAT